jgi:hypothetical protein
LPTPGSPSRRIAFSNWTSSVLTISVKPITSPPAFDGTFHIYPVEKSEEVMD